MKFSEFLTSKKSKKRVKQIAFFCVMMLTMSVMMATAAFAGTTDFVAIQSSDLEPILEGAKANIGVILPVGIGLFAIVIGIGFIPTIFRKFKNS